MITDRRNLMLGVVSLAAIGTLARPKAAQAASRTQLAQSGALSLQTLYSEQASASALASRAVGILVFPNIVKAGFVIGAQSGDGVLFRDKVPTAYYNLSSASFGLEAGVQSFAYALFFMNHGALHYLNQSAGWSLGGDPNIVVLDKGAAASIDTTTLAKDVYAIPYSQQGLMGGISLQGSKITQIHPDA
jgi:lipid-binding SYLF domain-containing protein